MLYIFKFYCISITLHFLSKRKFCIFNIVFKWYIQKSVNVRWRFHIFYL